MVFPMVFKVIISDYFAKNIPKMRKIRIESKTVFANPSPPDLQRLLFFPFFLVGKVDCGTKFCLLARLLLISPSLPPNPSFPARLIKRSKFLPPAA